MSQGSVQGSRECGRRRAAMLAVEGRSAGSCGPMWLTSLAIPAGRALGVGGVTPA